MTAEGYDETLNDGAILSPKNIGNSVIHTRRSLAGNVAAGVAFLLNAFVLLTILFSPEIIIFTAFHLLVKR